MAVTLAAVMRLNDEFSATLKSYYDQVNTAEKKTKEFQSSGVALGATLKNMSAQSGRTASGFGAITTKITGLISTVYLAKKAFDFLFDSIKTGAKQQVQLSTFQALMGNKVLGADVYNFVSAYAKKSALDRENLASATTSFLAFTKDSSQLKQLLDLTQRLYLFNPEQGAEGAVFALKEVMTGQTMSLKNRFNMNGISAEYVNKLSAKGDIAGTIKYLDTVFNQFGATQEVVDANFNSLSIQASLFKTNLMSAIGDQSNGAVQNLSATFQQLNADMDAGKFQPFFNVMSQGTAALANGLSWVAQNAYWLVPAVGGVVTALVVFNSAMMIARTVALLTGTTVSIVAGQWITAAALIAGAATTIGMANSLSQQNDDLKKSAATLSDVKSASAKLAADQKKFGASTLGNRANAPIAATVANKNPIKVSGTVEIEKENLKYVFEAAAAKFYAQFNATKVEPSINIAEQHVHQEADVNAINYALGDMVKQQSAVSAGGKYQ